MNNSVKKKVNFINSSQNKGLSLSCTALSFDRFGSISWHNIFFFGSFIVFTIFRISNFFGPSITDETWLVEMCIWCIKIGIVIVLYFEKQIKSTCRLIKCNIWISSKPQLLVSWMIYKLKTNLSEEIIMISLLIQKIRNR
jgi:hypothetical protein